MLFGMKNVNQEQLQSLIDNKVFENKELEYKDYSFTNGKMPDKQKEKFMKEIAAFANTNGGTIIIGMQEDNNRMPTRLTGVGFSIEEFDNWLSSFRQLILSRIRPHLHGVECIPVELNENNIAIVISVPKSYARPHSFWDGNKDEFFIRYANGITYMDIDDLRKEFLYSNGIQDKIRQFRKDRISMILANECVGDLGTDAKLVFFLIPEWSFELGNTIDFGYLENNSQFCPLSVTRWDDRYNADGYCIYGMDNESKSVNTYTQVFHNGIMEVVEIRLISKYQRSQMYDWMKIQLLIIERIEQYGEILENLNVPKPWYISASFLNARGYIADCGWSYSTLPIERDIIHSHEGICTEEKPLKEALKPVFNSLSNAFGLKKSSVF